MSQKQVMPKSEDISRSLEINAILTFDTEFPTIFNKSCTYIALWLSSTYVRESSGRQFQKTVITKRDEGRSLSMPILVT